MTQTPILKEMLSKLSGEYGGKTKYKWDKRFVWLTDDGIFWSTKEENYKIKNKLKLDQIDSVQYFGQFLEYEHVFFLYTKVKKHKKYFFACQNPEDCRKWVLMLQKTLEKHKEAAA